MYEGMKMELARGTQWMVQQQAADVWGACVDLTSTLYLAMAGRGGRYLIG